MVTTINDNVFDSRADCIVNTVNCVGFMGKGLALEFATRYPALEEQYIAQCKAKQINTGKVYFYNIDGQKILNFPTKYHYKYPSKIKWIEEGLRYFSKNYKEWGIKSIAFPLLGVSNGGLDVDEVIKLISSMLKDVDIDVYVCLNKNPDKLHEELLDKFNRVEIYNMSRSIKLNKNQFNSLKSSQNSLRKFADIRKLPSIGNETYKKIFHYLKEYFEFEHTSLF